jgi:hypothetical protein
MTHPNTPLETTSDAESERWQVVAPVDDGALIKGVTMRTRAMVIIAVSILAACSNRTSNRTITLTLSEEASKAFIDKNAARLATQLEKINYPATVTVEGEMVNVRVGQAPIRNVRRAICRRIGWPLSEVKTDEIGDRLKTLWRFGIRKVKIIGDTETMDVELGRDGSCQEDAR